jgi:hypothetical protein
MNQKMACPEGPEELGRPGLVVDEPLRSVFFEETGRPASLTYSPFGRLSSEPYPEWAYWS